MFLSGCHPGSREGASSHESLLSVVVRGDGKATPSRPTSGLRLLVEAFVTTVAIIAAFMGGPPMMLSSDGFTTRSQGRSCTPKVRESANGSQAVSRPDLT